MCQKYFVCQTIFGGTGLIARSVPVIKCTIAELRRMCVSSHTCWIRAGTGLCRFTCRPFVESLPIVGYLHHPRS